MKKFLCLFVTVVALVLSLAACSGVMKVNPGSLKLDKAYELTADIKYGEFEAVAKLTRENVGAWEIALLEPFALEGLEFTYNQGEVTAQFDGLRYNSQSDSRSAAVYKLTADALENAFCGDGREVVASGDEVIISGKTGDNSAYSYTLTLDRKSLQPLVLKLPDASITVEFSEARVSEIIEVINQGDSDGDWDIMLNEDDGLVLS